MCIRDRAYTVKERSLSNYQWLTVGGGDGFDAAPDPEDSNCGYGMSQGGNLYYFDVTTGMSRGIVPTESDVKHRYNWNAGFAVDPFHPATIYLGSQFVHRSPDKGRTWEIISPDLTTNDPEKQKQPDSGGLTLDVSSAENHCTIMCIAPSPVKEGVIWVGTDDGNVQLTQDAGKNWELVSKDLAGGKKPRVPQGTWVPQIEPSKFDAATAYVVFDDHRRSNWTPYVFVTHDFGKTWNSLATSEIDGFCFVIKEDTVNKNLLFLGTEFGLFVSFNGGANWMKWTQGFPTVPVYDLTIHPRENDLIIATHGRSLYVIDDISPLREISAELTKKKLHLFKVQDAIEFQQGRMSVYLSPGDTAFSGENKRLGACISYYLIPSERKPEEQEQQAGAGEEMQQRMMARMAQMGGMGQFRGMGMMRQAQTRVSITILNSQGQTISRFSGPEDKGINRAYWDFREMEIPAEGQAQAGEAQVGAAMFFRGARGGLTALPGTYTVKVKYEDQELSQSFNVKSDPRLKIDIEVLKANREKTKEAMKLSRLVTQVSQLIQQTQKAIQTFQDFARSQRNPKMMELMKAAREIDGKLKEFSEALSPTPTKQGMADRSSGLSSQVMSAVSGISGAGIEPVSQAAQVRYEKVKPKLSAFLAKFNDFFQKDVENFKKMLQDSGFSLFGPFTPLKLE